MANILILFASTDGHTIKICHRLKHSIEQAGKQVTLVSIGDYRQLDLQSYSKIVIGASIRYGNHDRMVFDFIDSNRPLLESKPNAFFSVNLLARKAAKNRPDTNPYVLKFLKRTCWQPRRLAVFAGKLDYPKYGFLDRLMIRFIMLITGGPTDPATAVEFTDWQRVDEFAQELCEL